MLITGLDLGAPLPALRDALIAETDWHQHHVRLYGRTLPQPRLTAWHGDPGAAYRYSGLRLEPLPWTDRLAGLNARLGAAAGAAFNSVLLNLYRDQHDGMGMHSDDEAELGPEPVIASLSLGEPRELRLRHRAGAAPPARVPLPDGSLLLMRGPTQRCWKHGIDKARRPMRPRLNLTFRHVRPIRGAV